MRARILAAMVGVIVAASAHAHAAPPTEQQLEESRGAFRKGVDEAKRGDYTSARDSFLRAYTLYPHPSILLNLGIARAHTGQYLEAEQDLVHFLADDGGAPPNEIASARTELADVRTHLGTFRLRVTPSGARAKLDARALALLPGAFVDVRTTVGSHALHVEADGHAPIDRSVFVESSRSSDIDLRLKPTTTGDVPTNDDAATRQTTGWIVLGGAAVVAGVGLASGLHAKSLADAYNTRDSGSFQDASTRSTGITFRTLADVAFVVAIVGGGVGVYLLATPPPSAATASSSTTRLVVGPSFTGVHGTF